MGSDPKVKTLIFGQVCSHDLLGYEQVVNENFCSTVGLDAFMSPVMVGTNMLINLQSANMLFPYSNVIKMFVQVIYPQSFTHLGQKCKA